MSNYHTAYGEVRRLSDDKMILHDHGGATCSDCMNSVLAELQALEADRDRWKREAEAARTAIDGKCDVIDTEHPMVKELPGVFRVFEIPVYEIAFAQYRAARAANERTTTNG